MIKVEKLDIIYTDIDGRDRNVFRIITDIDYLKGSYILDYTTADFDAD